LFFFPEFIGFLFAAIFWIVYFISSQTTVQTTIQHVLVKPSREKVVIDVEKLIAEREESEQKVLEVGKKRNDLKSGMSSLEAHLSPAELGDLATKYNIADAEFSACSEKFNEVDARCKIALEKLTNKGKVFQAAIDKLGESIFGLRS
jgi:hypothetical protein